MIERNWLDRLVSFMSPSAGAKRTKSRFKEQLLLGQSRKFEGASVGRRTAGWQTTSSSANTELLGAISTLRNRSRDLVRNDPYASRAMQLIASNVVGAGIVPQARNKSVKRVAIANQQWKAWGEKTLCDYDGNKNFYGIQALAMRTIAESGEVLIRKIISKDGGPVPLQIQILEPDYLATQQTSLGMEKDGSYIIQGVEFDKNGKRVAYWLYDRHPGDMSFRASGLIPKRVLASEVIHAYVQNRPGQVRGYPFAAPIVIKLRDLNEYDDAQLIRQKIAACYAAFVYDSEDASDLTTNDDNQLIDKFEPGMIERLPPGKDVKFGTPPTVDGYAEFNRTVLRGIAAGFGVPYEALTGDLSQVNFSSGRMGWLEFQRNIDMWRWQTLIPMMCDRVWQWFTELSTLNGSDIMGIDVAWTAPRREMIDPTREVAATRDAIRSGLQTVSDAIRQNGEDPLEHFKEYKSDNDLIDKLGLVLDCDPRKTSSGGQSQAAFNGAADNSSPNDTGANGGNG